MLKAIILASLIHSLPPLAPRGGAVFQGHSKSGAVSVTASINVTFSIGSSSTLAYDIKELGDGLYLVEYSTHQVGVRDPKNYSGKEIIFDQREKRDTACASLDMDGIHTKKNVIAMKWSDVMQKTMVAKLNKKHR